MQEAINQSFQFLRKKQNFGKSETLQGQTYSIRELLIRYQNGQRLSVNVRPQNPLVPEGTQECEEMPPQCGNFEELKLFEQKHHQRSQEFVKKMKEKREKKEEPKENLKEENVV